MVRVDFGCCLSSDKCEESYFINEVETMAANMLADHTKYPVVEEVAKAAYGFSKKVKGKKNIKGKRSSPTPLKKLPCRL